MFFYRDFDAYDDKVAGKQLTSEAREALRLVREQLDSLTHWQQDAIHSVITGVAAQLGQKMGKVAMPVRMAVTGGAPSPSLDLTLWLVGQARCLKRLDMALDYIKQHSA